MEAEEELLLMIIWMIWIIIGERERDGEEQKLGSGSSQIFTWCRKAVTDSHTSFPIGQIRKHNDLL